MPGSDNYLAAFDRFAAKAEGSGEGKKRTSSFVKKLTLDLDEEHLAIIHNRQKMEGVHLGARGVIWEALELLAEKYKLEYK